MTARWRSVAVVGSNAMGNALVLQQRHDDDLPTDEHRVVNVEALLTDNVEESE